MCMHLANMQRHADQAHVDDPTTFLWHGGPYIGTIITVCVASECDLQVSEGTLDSHEKAFVDLSLSQVQVNYTYDIESIEKEINEYKIFFINDTRKYWSGLSCEYCLLICEQIILHQLFSNDLYVGQNHRARHDLQCWWPPRTMSHIAQSGSHELFFTCRRYHMTYTWNIFLHLVPHQQLVTQEFHVLY